MPPTCASASTISTPGSVGRPGKWPAKNASSPVRCHRPRAERPGTTSSISSTKRNGGRWGKTSSGRTRERLLDGVFELIDAARLLAVHVAETGRLLVQPAIEQRAEDDDRLIRPHLTDVLSDVESV